jgi:hypothetical protein
MLSPPLEVFMRRSVAACSMIRCSALAALAVSALTGCPDRSIDRVDPLQGRVEAKDIPVNINRDLDLLFLIDDSPSMADKQQNLADNFPKFIEVLNSIPGGLPNVHIGVVTSDMGTQGPPPSFGPTVGAGLPGACSGVGKDGVLQTFGAPITGLYIVDTKDPVTGAPTRNYDPSKIDLATLFGQIATGANARGCGFEQHLGAIQRALVNPANGGFLRDTAYLGIIIIADEDDCSLADFKLLADDSSSRNTLGAVQSFRCTRFGVLCNQGGQNTDQMNQVGTKGQCRSNDDSQYLAKISQYVSFLQNLKKDPNKVIVAGIIGSLDQFAVELRTPQGEKTAIPALAHSCSYIDGKGNTEVADPPIRIKAFLDQFPNRSTFVPICQKDLSGGLQQIGDLLKTVIGDPCIEGKLKNFGTTGAPVYDCSVSSVTNPGTNNAMETIMAECPASGPLPTNAACWHIITDNVKCGTTPDHLVLKIENDDLLKMTGTDVHVLANCVTQSQ